MGSSGVARGAEAGSTADPTDAGSAGFLLRRLELPGMASAPTPEELAAALARLSAAQRGVIALLVGAFDRADLRYELDSGSDFADAAFGQAFGDILVIHHVLSQESFTKDKFEHGLASVLRLLGHDAELAPRGNAGDDLRMDGEKWSLKTQADRSIKPDRIHISKFMELGRGQWVTEADLAGLRDRMFAHMQNYDRIFTLRCLTAARSQDASPTLRYELVEIPKALLGEAAGAPCVMRQDSRQNPKPGHCTVHDDAGLVKFQLYFDGGTERKLQVRDLATRLCRIHARWEFRRPERSS